MSVHTHVGDKLNVVVYCFHDFLYFSSSLEKDMFDHVIFLPNVWELLRLSVMYPAATATCERGFSMMK